jgi:hypothetical protein
MKDIANIYKFKEEKFKEYVNDLWQDARPGMEGFAKRLEEKIRAMDTPNVVTLENSFGQGKTFFLTRFCEYLKQRNSDNKGFPQSIYLNLWENDYNPNPFSVIGEQILSEFYRDKKATKKSKLGQILKNLVKYSTLQGGSNIGLFKIECHIPLHLLFSKEREKNVRDFKEELQKMISEKNGNLVLIIDELDRCNPHYAVKTLQTVKHFFDIEGLIVILASTKDTLRQIFEGYYGFKTKLEPYASKFVNGDINFDISSLLDYEYLIQKHIKVPKICDNKDFVKDVSEMFYKARIIFKEDKNYNKDYKMSVREILKILDKWNFAMQRWLEEEIRENEKNFYTFAENVFYYYLREYGKKECNNLSLEQLPMPKEAKPKNFPAEKFKEQFGGLHEKITEIAEKIYRADALVSVGSSEK